MLSRRWSTHQTPSIRNAWSRRPSWLGFQCVVDQFWPSAGKEEDPEKKCKPKILKDLQGAPEHCEKNMARATDRVGTLNMSQLATKTCHFWTQVGVTSFEHSWTIPHDSMGVQPSPWFPAGFSPTSSTFSQEDQGRWMVRDRWRRPPHCLEGALLCAGGFSGKMRGWGVYLVYFLGNSDLQLVIELLLYPFFLGILIHTHVFPRFFGIHWWSFVNEAGRWME